MELYKMFSERLAIETERKRSCINFLNILSDLWYEHSVELVLFREELLDKELNEILNLHAYYSEFSGHTIDITDSEKIALIIKEMNLPPSKIDIAKLHDNYQLNGEGLSLEEFVKKELAGAKDYGADKPKDVVLYGFGRIGRLLTRILVHKVAKGSQLRLKAIVVRGAITREVLDKRASLLRFDSVHGKFPGTIEIDYENESLVVNGFTIKLMSANTPDDIDYTQYGINDALLIDNTGIYKDKESLSRHLTSLGVSKVLLTAPGKGIPNIVYGVNHKDHSPEDSDVFSAASCTTNAIVPILKVLEDEYGVESGHIETIHAYTNDQNLVDNMHPKYRRGRAAALNMVITETGAGKAVSKAIPRLEGRLTSSSIRVPVPNGSLVILNIDLNKATGKDDLDKVFKSYSLGSLADQIGYSLSHELVSSDIVGAKNPAVYDSHATIVSKEGKNVVLYIWYDNEYGYSWQVNRLARYVSKLRRFVY